VLATAWSAYLIYVALLPQLQEAKGIATANLGWLGTAGFLATFAGQTLIAPHADRLPQRVIAVAAGCVLAAGLALFAVANGLPALIAARALAGLGLGVLAPVVTAAAMRSARAPGGEGEARAAGLLQTAASAGIAIGPFLGALAVSRVDATTILLVGAGVLIVGLGVLRWIPHSAGSGIEATFDGAATLMHTRAFWGAALIGAAFMAAVGAYDTLWSRFMDDLGASSLLIGLSFVLFAVPYAVLAGPAGRYVDRTSPVRAAGLGAIAMFVSIVAYATLRNPSAIVLVALVESSGQAFVAVASTVAVARAAPVERQASAYGLSSGVSTLLAASTSMVAAPIYAAGGPSLLFGLTAGLYVLIMGTALRLTHGAAATARPDQPGEATGPQGGVVAP
jgi:MFS transporter, DHA1 family, multidrug resistance protein